MGFRIRTKETDTYGNPVQTWVYDGSFQVEAHVTGALLQLLDDVIIESDGIAITIISTGQVHFFYGIDFTTFIEGGDPDQLGLAMVDVTMEWQDIWEAGLAGIAALDQAEERAWAGQQVDHSSLQILLHEDSDPGAIGAELDWRAFRVALRAYLAKTDVLIVADPRPTL
jgi:hypothetical protein